MQIGHPLQPAPAQASVGLIMSATVMDARGRYTDRRAAQALVVGGLVSAAPTVLAGLADWVHGDEQHRRVGVLHAAANLVGLTACAAFGANHAEHVPHCAPSEWMRLCRLDELIEGKALAASAG